MPDTDASATPYPGVLQKRGSTDAAVHQIQVRLNQIGCGPIAENGVFDVATDRAVRLFQARHLDVTKRPLKVDGHVGSLTWGALFGASSVPSNFVATSELTEAVIVFAASQVGVMEDPVGSNRGPEIDEYLRSVGKNPAKASYAWCVAFTHFCYMQAAAALTIRSPHIKTAGVLEHWRLARTEPNVTRVTGAAATDDPTLVRPGALFIIDTGGGKGHSGIVLGVANGRLVTIEGNTNDDGSRDGIGVFRRDSRKVASINKGFIDYSAF
jgi:hypothetical protein